MTWRDDKKQRWKLRPQAQEDIGQNLFLTGMGAATEENRPILADAVGTEGTERELRIFLRFRSDRI